MCLSIEKLTGNEECKFILIKDTLEKSGRLLMKSLAAKFAKEKACVNYVCYDLPVDTLNQGLDCEKSNFIVHDAFSDPFSWMDEPNEPRYFSPRLLDEFSNASIVFMDSLSTYLLYNSASSVYRTLHQHCIASRNLQFVGLLHADAANPDDCHILETLATTTLQVQPIFDAELFRYQWTIRRSTGKVVRKNYECKISPFYEVSSLKEFVAPKPNQRPAKQPDPTANLTFNLKLTEMEKENREQVPLPYAKTQSSNPELVSGNALCEDDFYDEDDPDDDLDF